MAAFDEAWWDARTLVHGYVVHTLHQPRDFWVRWRLVDDLVQRFYLDFGLEPIFSNMGVEHYQVGLASPACRRAPRYFGRLCGSGGVHSGHEFDLETVNGVRLEACLEGDKDAHGVEALTWEEYRIRAIEAMGLATAGVVGHEGCFHRRGKSMTPLMYRLAVLLRTEGVGHLDFTDVGMITRTPKAAKAYPEDVRHIDEIIRSCGQSPDVPGPPRYTGVRLWTYQWVALRNDGWVATANGPLDAAELWRRGNDIETIAAAIAALSG